MASGEAANVPVNLSDQSQRWAAGLRFHVLQPPSKVAYRGVRGGHETESLTLADRDVVDGKVRAILIDGTPVVPILAADQQTTGFFRADADLALDHSGVVQEVNIDEIRWVLPDQIEMIDGVRGRPRVDEQTPELGKGTALPEARAAG